MATADVTHVTGKIVKSVIWDWLSDASGDYSQATAKNVSGIIERAVFIPDGGDTAPDNNYDVTLLDRHSVDILKGFGANRSSTSTHNVTDFNELVDEVLTLVVDNAGNANGGKCIIYYR